MWISFHSRITLRVIQRCALLVSEVCYSSVKPVRRWGLFILFIVEVYSSSTYCSLPSHSAVFCSTTTLTYLLPTHGSLIHSLSLSKLGPQVDRKSHRPPILLVAIEKVWVTHLSLSLPTTYKYFFLHPLLPPSSISSSFIHFFLLHPHSLLFTTFSLHKHPITSSPLLAQLFASPSTFQSVSITCIWTDFDLPHFRACTFLKTTHHRLTDLTP